MAERERQVCIRRALVDYSGVGVGVCSALFVFGSVHYIEGNMKEQEIYNKAIQDTIKQGYPKPDRKALNIAWDMKNDGEIWLNPGNPDQILAQLRHFEKQLELAKVAQVQDKRFQPVFQRNLEASNDERPSTLRFIGDYVAMAVGIYGGIFSGLLAFVKRDIRRQKRD